MRSSGARLAQLLGLYLCPALGTGEEGLDSEAWATAARGRFHMCMILENSTLKCFGARSSVLAGDLAPTESVNVGFGNFGQIGSDNEKMFSDGEGEMGRGLPDVDLGHNTPGEVAAGQSHACVSLTSGHVACFGFNDYGQLGIGIMAARGQSPNDLGEGLAMVDLGANRTAMHIACSQHHSGAVLDNGSLKCWGKADMGMENRGDGFEEMGDNWPTVDLGTGRTAKRAGLGRYHTCAVLDKDSLKCWGGGNSKRYNHGHLGHLGQGDKMTRGVAAGQMGDALLEVDLGKEHTVKALAVGWFHTCVIFNDGNLRCFGSNSEGQLGLGGEADRGNEPGGMGAALENVDLGTGLAAVAVACGRRHTCILLNDSSVQCFGANTSYNLDAEQLGLEVSDNPDSPPDTEEDNLEVVGLGSARIATWILAAFDCTCVSFSDNSTKCWDFNAPGQLGRGDTDGGRRRLDEDDGSEGTGLSQDGIIVVCVLAPLVVVAVVYFLCRQHRWCLKHHDGPRKRPSSKFSVTLTQDDDEPTVTRGLSDRDIDIEAVVASSSAEVELVARLSDIPEPFLEEKLVSSPATSAHHDIEDPDSSTRSSTLRDLAAAATAATAGMVIVGGAVAGWNMLGVVAEHLPWIGAAYNILSEIGDIVDTKRGMEGNMDRISSWAGSLKEVLRQMNNQMQVRPALNAGALKSMSFEVLSNLEILKSTVESYDRKGTLAQFAACRRCQTAVDDADTALRGALAKLAVGQGAELISMVGSLQDSGLVIDEKMDFIIEQLHKQEERQTRMELRLAEYSESMAEVFKGYASGNGRPPAGKTMQELSKETLDNLQISNEDISYASTVPFDTGTMSEVYQVVHEGTLKAAKKTNLTRLGVASEDVDRVFRRFVKELYILHQMRSDRVVSVYGAVVSHTELTLITEFAARGSIRKVLEDDVERKELMTPERQHAILLDTAAGMTYLCSRGVEHRDLKSANCLVTHDWRVKISDFGLSKTTDALSTGSASTVSSFRGGTLIYMAPELVVGGTRTFGDVPAELSDVFSFGVIVWEIMCGNGERPWAHISVGTLPERLREEKRPPITSECNDFYRTLMQECWHQSPGRRPRFDRLHTKLKEYLLSSRGPASLGQPPKSPTTPIRTKWKRRPVSDAAIPYPAGYGFGDPAIDAKSGKDSHSRYNSAPEVVISYGKPKLRPLSEEQPSPSLSEQSSSTRAIISSESTAPAPLGSAATTPHGEDAADPERTPMRQPVRQTHPSPGPALSKEALVTLAEDEIDPKSSFFSALGRRLHVSNEISTYVECAERQQVEEKATSLNGIATSPHKRSLSIESAPAVVQKAWSKTAWPLTQKTEASDDGTDRTMSLSVVDDAERRKTTGRAPHRESRRDPPSLGLLAKGSNRIGGDISYGSTEMEGGTTGTAPVVCYGPTAHLGLEPQGTDTTSGSSSVLHQAKGDQTKAPEEEGWKTITGGVRTPGRPAEKRRVRRHISERGVVYLHGFRPVDPVDGAVNTGRASMRPQWPETSADTTETSLRRQLQRPADDNEAPMRVPPDWPIIRVRDAAKTPTRRRPATSADGMGTPARLAPERQADPTRTPRRRRPAVAEDAKETPRRRRAESAAGAMETTVRGRTEWPAEGTDTPRRRLERSVDGTDTPRRRMGRSVDGTHTPRWRVDRSVNGTDTPGRRMGRSVDGTDTPRRRLERSVDGTSTPRRRLERSVDGTATPRRRVGRSVDGTNTPRRRLERSVDGTQTPRRRMERPVDSAETLMRRRRQLDRSADAPKTHMRHRSEGRTDAIEAAADGKAGYIVDRAGEGRMSV